MIDIDRLHAVIENDPTERMSGRTTSMLITAAQLSDFNKPLVFIIGKTYNHAKSLFWHFLRVATEMEYDAKVLRVNQIQIGDTIFRFESNELALLGISDDTDVFVDHLAEEQ